MLPRANKAWSVMDISSHNDILVLSIDDCKNVIGCIIDAVDIGYIYLNSGMGGRYVCNVQRAQAAADIPRIAAAAPATVSLHTYYVQYYKLNKYLTVVFIYTR